VAILLNVNCLLALALTVRKVPQKRPRRKRKMIRRSSRARPSGGWRSARYRFTASMADLERSYDEQASRLRAAFVAEVAALYQSEAA
jgi:hypothetical protein